MKPNQVMAEISDWVFQNLYSSFPLHKKNQLKLKLKKLDGVIISRLRRAFDKKHEVTQTNCCLVTSCSWTNESGAVKSMSWCDGKKKEI